MKAKKIFLGLTALALVALVVVSCQKSYYCLCITEETQAHPDTIIVNVDNDMNCKHILQLGVQKLDSVGNPVIDSIFNFTCTKIHKDSLSPYNNLHVEQR